MNWKMSCEIVPTSQSEENVKAERPGKKSLIVRACQSLVGKLTLRIQP